MFPGSIFVRYFYKSERVNVLLCVLFLFSHNMNINLQKAWVNYSFSEIVNCVIRLRHFPLFPSSLKHSTLPSSLQN